jgi:hypothetical protein
MLFDLLTIASTLCAREVPVSALACERMRNATYIVAELDDAYPEERAMLLSIAWHESRGDSRALSSVGLDAGALQMRALWWGGMSRAAFLADERAQYRLGLAAMRTLRKQCGGPALRWLGAYASGKCGGAPSKARELCAPVGLCDWRPGLSKA